VSDTELLPMGAVSKETCIPLATLRYYRATNTGPKSFKLAGRIVYRRSDLQRWITEQESGSVRGG
jgi:DNA-binding transcriptional MerR regulator